MVEIVPFEHPSHPTYNTNTTIHTQTHDQPTRTPTHTHIYPPTHTVIQRLPLNDNNLRRAWECSSRSTKEDWAEWMRHFSVELLKESPSPALRACHAIALVGVFGGGESGGGLRGGRGVELTHADMIHTHPHHPHHPPTPHHPLTPPTPTQRRSLKWHVNSLQLALFPVGPS